MLEKIYRIDGWPNVRAAAEHSAKPGPGIRVPIRGRAEEYDCVVVGAGASGLAAAKYYRDRFGPDKRVLVLDPLPDFGGHSHRNEFHVPNAAAGGADLMILRNGGTVNLDSIGAWNQPAGSRLDIPGSYGQPALDMLTYCGVDPHNFPAASAPGIPSSYGLRQMLLFPAADWGADTLAQNRVNATEPSTVAGWTAFVNRLPYSAAAKAAIVRIQTGTTDWLQAKHGPMSVDDKLRLLHEDHLQAVPHELSRRARGGDRPVPAHLARAARRRRAGDVRLRHVAPRASPGFAASACPTRKGLTFPGIGRTPQMGNMVGAEPVGPLAGRQHVAAAPAGEQAHPGGVPGRRRRPPNQENIVKAAATTRSSTVRATSCGSG